MAKLKGRTPKTIFFTKNHATEEEVAEAAELGNGVVLRRADLVRPDGALEDFDRVAGAVPERYAAEAAKRARAAEDSPEPDAPKADAASVKDGSPVAPVVAPGTVTPTPKPGGAGWQKNA